MQLTDLDLTVLRKLVNGEAVDVSSQHRLRLELAGAIRDGPRGIVATPHGIELVRMAPLLREADASGPDDRVVARDGRGRRLPFQRKANF